MSLDDQLNQLDTQQALLTDVLKQMLQNRWVGEVPTVEADLLALDPSLQLAPRPPASISTAPQPPPAGVQWNPEENMPRQAASWTCSACSLAWVERSTGSNPSADEWSAVSEIGQPENINPTYGLMDGSGAQLQRVLRDSYNHQSQQGWLNFDTVWAAAAHTCGMMSGGNWYHWVAIRGQSGSDIYIANSAPGYKGVYSTLSRDQFNSLGPFSVVLLTT